MNTLKTLSKMTPGHRDNRLCSLFFNTPFLLATCQVKKNRKQRTGNSLRFSVRNGSWLVCSSFVLHYLQPPVPVPLLPIISTFPPHISAANKLACCLVRASGCLSRCLPTLAVMANSIIEGSVSNPEATGKSLLSASTNIFVFQHF